jgi:hypothetical protein
VLGRKQPGESLEQESLGVEKVPLSSLRRKRRSKHHELMQQILTELIALPSESALKVPLGKASAKDLRSAVVRAASSKSIDISSTSDGSHLYVWKKPEPGRKTRINKRPSR